MSYREDVDDFVDCEDEPLNENGCAKQQKKIKTSPAWNLFSEIENKKAKCLVCRRTVAVSGSVGNLNHHIRRNHPSEWKKIQQGVECSAHVQGSISQFFASVAPEAKRTIDNALVEWICSDMLALRLVESSHFRRFCDLLRSGYIPPTRQHLAGKLIPALYQQLREKLQGILAATSAVALTCDSWTSNSNDSFLTIAAHFIPNSSWKLQSLVLQTRSTGLSNTASNIASFISEAKAEWGIPMISAIATDNAKSMLNAVELLHCHSVPCCAHSLQLCVRKMLKDDKLDAVIAKCRRLVSYFHASSLRTNQFASALRAAGKEPKKLVQDVATRWNSTYAMLVSVLSQLEAITSVLAMNRDLTMALSSSEEVLCRGLLQLLRPAVQITDILSQSVNVSISSVLVCMDAISSALNSIRIEEISEDITVILNDARTRFAERMQEWRSKCSMDILCAAEKLDPRYKQRSFPDRHSIATTGRFLKEMTMESASSPTSPPSPLSAVSEATPHEATELTYCGESMESIMSSLIGERSTQMQHEKSVEEEFEQFINFELPPPRNSDPLSWWSLNQSRYPKLASVAKKILAIPATSAPAERIFSKAGWTVNERRSRLSPKLIDKLVFISENLNKLNAHPE